MNWFVKSFQELSSVELYSLLKLRSEVFVVEQTCIYNDMDDLDFDAIHLFPNCPSNSLTNIRCFID